MTGREMKHGCGFVTTSHRGWKDHVGRCSWRPPMSPRTQALLSIVGMVAAPPPMVIAEPPPLHTLPHTMQTLHEDIGVVGHRTEPAPEGAGGVGVKIGPGLYRRRK